MGNVGAKRNAWLKTTGVVAILLTLLLAFAMTGCSSSSSTKSKGAEQINGHSVSEYNSDIDNLERILNKAKSLNNKIEAMGNPDNFTTQSQVDDYNDLVNQYNIAADEYNSAAKAFSRKYGTTIDGAGTSPTDPDNIDLPKKK